MTAVDHDVPSSPPASNDVAIDPPITFVCPYLAAADGAWRSAAAAREHRCMAVAPFAPLATEKQRRLCLTADHLRCATFEAALAARPVAHDRVPTLPRPLARTTPVVLDHGRLAISRPTLDPGHVSGQAILVGLMAIAFAAIILARLTGGGGSAGAGVASPTPQTTVSASATSSSGSSSGRPTATPAPTLKAEPSAASGGSAVPATPPPSTAGTRTYKVKAGDTLVGIAAKFGTTPKAIVSLNGITNPSSLKVGQVLQIP